MTETTDTSATEPTPDPVAEAPEPAKVKRTSQIRARATAIEKAQVEEAAAAADFDDLSTYVREVLLGEHVLTVDHAGTFHLLAAADSTEEERAAALLNIEGILELGRVCAEAEIDPRSLIKARAAQLAAPAEDAPAPAAAAPSLPQAPPVAGELPFVADAAPIAVGAPDGFGLTAHEESVELPDVDTAELFGLDHLAEQAAQAPPLPQQQRPVLAAVPPAATAAAVQGPSPLQNENFDSFLARRQNELKLTEGHSGGMATMLAEAEWRAANNLGAPAQVPLAPAPAAVAQGAFCSNCGAPASGRFCGSCGTQL